MSTHPRLGRSRRGRSFLERRRGHSELGGGAGTASPAGGSRAGRAAINQRLSCRVRMLTLTGRATPQGLSSARAMPEEAIPKGRSLPSTSTAAVCEAESEMRGASRRRRAIETDIQSAHKRPLRSCPLTGESERKYGGRDTRSSQGGDEERDRGGSHDREGHPETDFGPGAARVLPH